MPKSRESVIFKLFGHSFMPKASESVRSKLFWHVAMPKTAQRLVVMPARWVERSASSYRFG